MTPPAPLSVIVFGSLARGDAHAGSDIDIVVVRPDGVDDDHDPWHATLEQWRQYARRLTGNPVEILDVGAADAPCGRTSETMASSSTASRSKSSKAAGVPRPQRTRPVSAAQAPALTVRNSTPGSSGSCP